MKNRINLARSAFSHLQSCLWPRREISVRTKGGIYHALVQSILLCGCETWQVRVADGRMLEVFDNGRIQRILHVRCRDYVTTAEMRYRLRPTSIPAMVPKRLAMVWSRSKAQWRLNDRVPTSSHTVSGVTKVTWSPSPRRESSATHNGKWTGRKPLVRLCRTVEPRLHLSETWSAHMVMPDQLAPVECRHKYFAAVLRELSNDFRQSFLHCMWPKSRGPEWDCNLPSHQQRSL